MAKLNISRATYGIDSKRVDTYLTKIKASNIEKGAKQLRKYADEVKGEVAKVWVGTGADNFTNALKGDAYAIAKKVEALYDKLDVAIKDVMRTYSRKDRATTQKTYVK